MFLNVAPRSGQKPKGDNSARREGEEDMRELMARIWINAFIPEELPDLTQRVPAGTHEGATMIPGPVPGVSDCFLTDQRAFSDDPSASSRMHSLVEIDLQNGILKNEEHRSDPTIEIDCEDGDEECNRSATTSGLTVQDFASEDVDSGKQMSFRFVGEASNSCFTGAPDIDWNVALKVTFHPAESDVVVDVEGEIDPFPAFEMYAEIDGGFPEVLFKNLPDVGSSPADLWEHIGASPESIRASKSFSL